MVNSQQEMSNPNLLHQKKAINFRNNIINVSGFRLKPTVYILTKQKTMSVSLIYNYHTQLQISIQVLNRNNITCIEFFLKIKQETTWKMKCRSYIYSYMNYYVNDFTYLIYELWLRGDTKPVIGSKASKLNYQTVLSCC